MEEFKSNSYKSREAANPTDRKVEKVVSGTVKVKKKSEVHKFKDVFIAEDAHHVKSYILMEVLVPAVKKAVKDIVTDGIEMLLYGEAGKGSGKRRGDADYVSYNRFSDRRDEPRRDSYRARSLFDYNELVFPSRGEAEAVLDRMDEILDVYKVVSVLDFYDMAGVNNDNPQTKKYGWTNIRNAEVVRVRDGYTIRLPKALPIN